MVTSFKIADLFPEDEFAFVPITPPPKLIPQPMFQFPPIPTYLEAKREDPLTTYTAYLNSVFPHGRKGLFKKKTKMTMTYKQMIIVAIGASPNKKVNLRQLVEWIQGNFPECRERDVKSWKGTVRNALTRHEEFEKLQGNGDGRAAYWTWNYKKATPCKRNNGHALDIALISFFKQSNIHSENTNRVTLEDVRRAVKATRSQ